MNGRGRGSGRGCGRARPQAAADAPPGLQSDARSSDFAAKAERYGFSSDFNPEDFFSSNAAAMFANMPAVRSLTGGRGIVKKTIIPAKEKPVTGIAYAEQIQQEAEAEAIQARKKMRSAAAGDAGPEMEAESSGGAAAAAAVPHAASVTGTTNLEGVSTVLASEQQNMINFQSFFTQQRNAGQTTSVKSLPIEAHRQEIIRTIRMNQVTVIEGKTGCGKTTRVPVFVMEDMASHSEQFNIVVTQPRRIAAVSVAKRVACSCGYELGKIVGYQIGMDRNFVGPDTHLLYCTTGVLLQKVINSKKEGTMHLDYTHIVIDEIHERNVDTDMLLMILRKYIWECAPKVKLILMSATFQTERFVEYFRMKSQDPEVAGLRPNVISIQQQPNKLSLFYLEEFEGKFELPKRSEFVLDEPQLLTDLYDVTLKIIKNMTVLESQNRHGRGAVLIFLPGLMEITELKHILEGVGESDLSAKFWVLPLHSSITDEEQRLVFEKPQHGMRKIILSTNIAESSITVPDIEYVIDFCLTKNLVVDKKTGLPSLMLEWTTQASCKQRAGRAGRTMDGRAFHLVYSTFHRQFEKYPKAEILNIPLENCVLSAKVLDMGPPKKILALCLDPPKIEDIRSAVLKLKRAGGLTVMDADGRFELEDGSLTAVGRVMKQLPIDVNASKLIVLGYVFGLVEEAIIMAACLTVNTVFARAFGQELESYKSRMTWSDRSFCDLFSYFNAFLNYQQFKQIGPSSEQLKNWTRTNFIQLKRMSEVEETVRDIERRLDDCKVCRDKPPNLQMKPVERELVLKFMIAGAFYPNYFMRQPLDPVLFGKAMPGHNPHSSVILSGFPAHQGVLYAEQVRRLMRPASDMIDLDFEETKAIVTFSSERNALSNCIRQQNDFLKSRKELEDSEGLSKVRETVIKSSVYVAVKMGKLRRDNQLTIRLMNQDDARQKIAILTAERDKKFDEARLLRCSRFRVPAFSVSEILKPALPTSNLFGIAITCMEECAHFYAKYFDEESQNTGRRIAEAVTMYQGLLLKEADAGMLVLVATENNGHVEYQRSVVVDVAEKKAQVRKLDMGGKEWVAIDSLVLVDPDTAPAALLLPAQSFECRLAEIKPSSFRNIYGSWDEEANNFFDGILRQNNGRFTAEIFSIIDGVFRVRLTSLETRDDVNELLMDKGWAETADESHESRQNHEMRKRMAHNLSVVSVDTSPMYNVSMPDIRNATSKKIQILKGPNSPLECKFAGITCNMFTKSIKIDPKSVNSITLEPEPLCEFQRMLVAAQSTLQYDSQKVVARETCMMPVIPGLPALICLTFSPVCELRCEKDLFLGALCGLGAESIQGNMYSYDADHDIEIPFDVVFTRKEIADINSIRYRISIMLDDQMKGRFELAGNPLFKRQQQLRASIVSLMQRRRMRLPPGSMPHFNFRWGLLQPQESAVPQLRAKNLFLQMIQIPKIGDFIRRATNELELFRNLTKDDFGKQSVVCPLDNQTLRCMDDLSEHRNNKDHRTRFMELIFQQEDENQAAQEDRRKNRSAPAVHTEESESGAGDPMDQS